MHFLVLRMEFLIESNFIVGLFEFAKTFDSSQFEFKLFLNVIGPIIAIGKLLYFFAQSNVFQLQLFDVIFRIAVNVDVMRKSNFPFFPQHPVPNQNIMRLKSDILNKDHLYNNQDQNMNEEIISLPSKVKNPILVMKRIDVPHLQSKQKFKHFQYFLISTVDSYFFIYSFSKEKQKCQFHLQWQGQFDFPVCESYYDKQSQSIYLGLYNGDIKVLDLSDSHHKLKIVHYQNKNDNLSQQTGDSHIELIYSQGKKLFVINGFSEAIILDKGSLKQKGRHRFQNYITCAIAIDSPHSYNKVGCIGFLNKRPPLLFDCEIIENFEDEQLKGENLMKEEDVKQGQVVKMCYGKKDSGYNYLVCGVFDIQWQISVYTIEQGDEIEYCERRYKFQLQKEAEVQHLSIEKGILISTYWNKFSILDIQKQKTKEKLNKSGMKISWGFILHLSQTHIIYLLSKGFNPLHPEEFKPKTPRFHIFTKQWS